MELHLLYLSLLAIFCASGAATDECEQSSKTVRVAIIGCGVTAAATSHFIRNHPTVKHLSKCSNFPYPIKIEIDAYERNSYVGGRVSERLHNGNIPIPEGASLVHSSNKYVLEFIEAYNLTLSPITDKSESEYSLAFFDGNSIAWKLKEGLKQSADSESNDSESESCKSDESCPSKNYSWMNYVKQYKDAIVDKMSTNYNKFTNIKKMFQRYGFSNMISMSGKIDGYMTKWSKVYDNLEKKSYNTVLDLFKDLDLVHTIQVGNKQLFSDSELFVSEMVSGIIRRFWGQSEDTNGFVGIVGLAGAQYTGFTGTVEEGPQSIPARVLKANADHINLRSQVSVIESVTSDNLQNQFIGPKWRLIVNRSVPVTSGQKSQNNTEAQNNSENQIFADKTDIESQSTSELYDAVIIATPIQTSELSFVPEIDEKSQLDSLEHFQVVHYTWAQAKALNHKYFNASEELNVANIFTPEYANDKIPFTDISTLITFEDNSKLFQLSSRKYITDEVVKSIFDGVEIIHRKVWKAFSRLVAVDNVDKLPSFRLGNFMYYPNAMESVISTMETQSIAAKNTVELFLKDLVDLHKTEGTSDKD